MKIGDIITSDGISRKVVGFSIVSGIEMPITQIVEDESTEEAESALEEPKKEKGSDKAKEIAKNNKTEIKYCCNFCGKELGSKLSYMSHVKICKKNPQSPKFEG